MAPVDRSGRSQRNSPGISQHPTIISQMSQSRQPSQLAGPRIVRASLDQLTIYEISDNELEAIERGGPESLMLNFAILFTSTAISFTISLATTEIHSIHLFSGFMVTTIVSYFAALVLGGLWVHSCRSKKSLIKIIRERRPPEGEPLPPPIDQSTIAEATTELPIPAAQFL